MRRTEFAKLFGFKKRHIYKYFYFKCIVENQTVSILCDTSMDPHHCNVFTFLD